MSLETVGSTAFSRARAVSRIENITAATAPTQLVLRFGIAIGYLSAGGALRALSRDEWVELLAAAEQAYVGHPMSVDKSSNLSEINGKEPRPLTQVTSRKRRRPASMPPWT